MSDLGRIPRLRRSGDERFRNGGAALSFDLLSFWQWGASDLVSNTLRGVLAEYLREHLKDGHRNHCGIPGRTTPRGPALGHPDHSHPLTS